MPVAQKPPKNQTPQQHAQQIARQMANEPLEILKSAAVQLGDKPESSTEWKKQSSVNLPQTGEQPGVNYQEKIIKEKRRRQSQIEAFQNELSAIKQIQDGRQREKAEAEYQEQANQDQQKAQTADQKFGPLEVIGKIKRGMFGGAKGNVHKKQRSTELVKTPSN